MKVYDACTCANPIGFVRTSSPNYEDFHDIEGYLLKCHQWRCPTCAKVLKNQLLDRIHLGLEDKSDFFFMTLTSSFREMDIKAAWARFRARMWHNYPIGLFVWVMELTPPSHPYTDWRGVTKVSVGGLRHFHVLISFTQDLPSEQVISDYWKDSTKGKAWEVHFERLHDIGNPAGYLAKYVTKALQVGYLYNEKRVGFSNNFPKLPLNLEPQKGVYLSYDPRHPVEQNDDFAKMLEEANLPFKNKGKKYL